MADHTGREPGKIQITSTLDKLLERLGEHVWLAAAHEVFGVDTRGIGQLVVRAQLDRIDCFAGIEVIQVGAGQRLAVLGIHGIRTHQVIGGWGRLFCRAPEPRKP